MGEVLSRRAGSRTKSQPVNIAMALAEDRPPLNNRAMFSRLIPAFTRPPQARKAHAAEQGHG